MEAKAGEVKMAKTERRGKERGIRKETKGKGAKKKRKKKPKEGEDNKSEKSSRRVGDLK